MRTSARLFLVLAVLIPHAVLADLTHYLPRESAWKLFQGLAEPSVDPAAWRSAEFDDSAWPTWEAPFGYGVASPIATDLSQLTPPMRSNYSTLYLRSSFELSDPSGVVVLQANVDYDDGFILWVNGVEVAQSNAPEVMAPPFDAVATRSHVPGTLELFDEMPNPQTFLVNGTNTVAVQAFNVSRTNNDFKFDLEIFDPFGPDLSPPAMTAVTPPAGATVRSLSRIEVTFNEAVRGVGATDLLVSGNPASSVAGEAAGPYIFGFPAAPDGDVAVRWAAMHGITDLSERANAFAGGEWSYRVDSTVPEADLVINEISAAGGVELSDEDGDSSDWIEVLNRGVTHVQLLGWSLSDDAQEPGKWTFPNVTLAPHDHIVVFASSKDRKAAGGELHASFSLAASGEHLGLYTPESPRAAVSELTPRFPDQRFGYSYGLDADGKLAYLSPPTPGAPNASSASLEGVVSEPFLSVPHGLYEGPFDLAMASRTAAASIRYTLDGSEPTLANGTTYSEPIEIAGTSGRGAVTVRAVAFKDRFLPSIPVTNTYIFPSHVLTQPRTPEGFPSAWGSQPADYAMDPTVVAQAGDRALQGLLSIPHLSLVTHVDNLFGRAQGIYANPSASGLPWERPVSAELMHPDGRRGFQVDCGLRITGGSSTSDWKSIKLSLRLIFRGDYGAKKLEERLFEGSLVDRFDSVVLDAHLNLAYTHPDHAQRVRSQFVRDIFVSDLQRAAGSLAPHGRFVHLYLNGLYWGMYDMHERPDSSFAAEHLGGDKSEYDSFRHNSSTVVDGNSIAWNEMFRRARLNLQVPENYQALGEYLDFGDLADYMIVNIYAGNTDWAHQNWYAGRRRTAGAGFRFFSWDAEHVLKSTSENVLAVNNPGGPSELYTRLRANPDFRLLFADHVHRHFFDGGPMHVDAESPAWDADRPENNRPAALYMKRIAEIDTAVILESARWGDARRPGQPYTRDNEFQAELDLLLDTYFPQRTRVVLGQLTGSGLYPRLAAPGFSRHGGDVEPGFSLSISLPAGTTGKVIYTTDGSDPRAPVTGDVSPSGSEYAGPIILTDSTRVKARTLNEDVWSALAEAVFTVVGPRDALRITEIMYHPPGEPEEGGPAPLPEFIEVQNASGATVDLTGIYFSSGIDFFFERGTTLGAGKRLVLTSDAAAFEAHYPGVEAAGEFGGALSNGGEKVTLRDADGEVVASVEYDDEGFWPQGPDGFGWSLVLEGDLDPADPEGWRASASPGGSPGEPERSEGPGGVIVNEVLASSSDPFEDAIELFNPTDRAIGIGGWYLSDDRGSAESLMKFRIPGGATVPAGGYVVLHELEFNGGIDSPGGFGLAGDGDEVILASADAAGNLTGYITGHQFDAAEDGVSIGRIEASAGARFAALCAATFGADLPSSLEEFRAGRGALNAEPRLGPIVINEVHHNPAAGVEFVELHNTSGASVPLHDDGLGRGWRLSGILNDQGTDDFELSRGASVPARGFLLLVPVEPAAFRELHTVPEDVVLAGPYRGALDNAGERLRLLRPILDGGMVVHVPVDSVRYDDEAPWPVEADGQGPSLERVTGTVFGDDPANWAASIPDGGTPGAVNSRAKAGAGLKPRASFTALPGDAGELSVVFDGSDSMDPDGLVVKHEWTFGDDTASEGSTASHVYRAAGRYTVRLKVTDDGGASSVAVRAIIVPTPGSGGGQVPGDANQDARLDLADPITLILGLFLGEAIEAPCGGASLVDGGSLTLLDVDSNGAVNVSDILHVLNYLFRGGPEPDLGVGCIRIPGCPDLCSP